MASENLNGLRVAILATDGFEQVELMHPRQALDEAGAKTQVIAPKDSTIRGWNFTEWGDQVAVDLKLDNAGPRNSMRSCSLEALSILINRA